MAELKRGVCRVACLVAVAALGLGGCVRQGFGPIETHRYGSLKDDPVVYERPAAKAARAPAAKLRTASVQTPHVLPPLKPAVTEAPPPPDLKPAPPPRIEAPAPAIERTEEAKPEAGPSASVAIEAPRSAPDEAPKAAPAEARKSETASPAPDEPRTDAPPLDAMAVERLLNEGKALFDSGRVVEARRRFLAAMNGPLPEVLLSLARTYDTYYLSRLPSSDAAPDMQRALVLYERAAERGAIEANADLERTRSILKIPR